MFVLFGERKRTSSLPELPNLHYAGFVSHPNALQAMKAVDVLLMPYQHSVSIGVRGHDTARWMSPMKMFEYLASGTPIVSSDLTVLREVLRHGENALLVPPTAVDQWAAAVRLILDDRALAERLGRAGHATYEAAYTWTARARRILEAAA